MLKKEPIVLNDNHRKLIEDNISFIWFFYQKFVPKNAKFMKESDKEELISDLYYNFCIASVKYNPERGKFLTIAYFYLRRAISDFFIRKNKLNKNIIFNSLLMDETSDSDPICNKFDKSGEKKENYNYNESIENKEIIKNIFKKIKLTKEEKKFIIYHYKFGYNITDIAKKMRKKKSSIRSYKNSVVHKIRKKKE